MLTAFTSKITNTIYLINSKGALKTKKFENNGNYYQATDK